MRRMLVVTMMPVMTMMTTTVSVMIAGGAELVYHISGTIFATSQINPGSSAGSSCRKDFV